ncbi:thioredoxin family protein [Ralstonia pseudosolanacearum]|uniref:thioredoxin family protein n=1 Tax=Ralstonia solanacearum species complex bacterium KE056 TaxID=3119585 RepID=UPI002FC38F23
MSVVQSLNEGNFEKYVQEGRPVKVLRFWATWCSPCRALLPVYEEVANELSEIASFAEIDIDHSPGLADAFGIRSVPVVIVMKDGAVVDNLVGLKPKARYIDSVKRFM